ncbi:MAG: hypothetical protein JNK78_15835 [Planctomycetes bacterium]|nr:hypothetical protein [Planctomycetota bacterium]
MLAFQVIVVAPSPATIGEQVVVRAKGVDEEPIAGLAIEVVEPDGKVRAIGTTDQRGEVSCTPTIPGEHVFGAAIGSVAVLAPHHVVGSRRTWFAALVAVPLGLAALWAMGRACALSRSRGRRDP